MSIRIEAHDLSIGYDHHAVVTDLNFVLSAGETLALVGTNGSGKSTLLTTIAGLREPVAGELTFAPAQPTIGYLAQFHGTAGVLPLRVRDVVMMARYSGRGLLGRLRHEDHSIVDRSIERVGLTHLASSPLRALSGGQQQRVHLAYVLACEADLLLLDEPTAGLDAGATERYLSLVREERERGAAVVIATHDVSDAARADQVILLSQRVVAAGPPREVLTPERLAETFGISLLAIPHGDHTDLVVPDHPHGHEEHHPPPHHHPNG